MIRALLFDAAGTLIRTAEPVAETYARLLSPALGPLESATLEASFRSAFGMAGVPDYGGHPTGDLAERAWWRSVVENTVGRSVSDDDFRLVFDHYAIGSAWQLFPEVESVLCRARDAGLRCAVVSNFDLRLHGILDQLKLTRHFDLVVTSAEARARKPSPRIFDHALARLGLDQQQVLHVGDSRDADLGGASAAGIEAFHIGRPEQDLDQFMDWVLDQRGN